uniref:C2 domain-containing protein n=1 Tax=Timema douglasi TaxID=61478 RepID=A0A7R8VN24_TIMDO|nr:unnamed protein product [Timema douglasi]
MDGLSDPFCTLYLSSANTHRYNTSVKSATLCPVWEEHFSLHVSPDCPSLPSLSLFLLYECLVPSITTKLESQGYPFHTTLLRNLSNELLLNTSIATVKDTAARKNRPPSEKTTVKNQDPRINTNTLLYQTRVFHLGTKSLHDGSLLQMPSHSRDFPGPPLLPCWIHQKMSSTLKYGLSFLCLTSHSSAHPSSQQLSGHYIAHPSSQQLSGHSSAHPSSQQLSGHYIAHPSSQQLSCHYIAHHFQPTTLWSLHCSPFQPTTLWTFQSYLRCPRDFDPAETVREKMMKFGDVKGVKGLRKLMKEIAVTASTGKHDNELVGSALMALRFILKHDNELVGYCANGSEGKFILKHDNELVGSALMALRDVPLVVNLFLAALEGKFQPASMLPT